MRRTSTLVACWRDDALTVQNYRTGRVAPAVPPVLELLDYCAEWRTLPDVFATFSEYSPSALRGMVSLLAAHTFLERARGPAPRRVDVMEAWRSWSPEAALFHFGTKDGEYRTQEELQAELLEKAAHDPAPSPLKAYRGLPRTPLPAAAAPAPLDRILRDRRTWRRFGRGRLDLDTVAALLNATWGVQGWAETGLGPCALKTSPSGGARHPIEVYLLARRVEGLPAGCYHYDPDAHALVMVRRGLGARRLEAHLAGQSCYANVPAVFMMTAVFARTQWRYASPRAYRVVLLEAGHLCQTFCLVATALGLAPFCTAAFADSLVERDLGIDGVKESALYACGAGPRPKGVGWAPWPDMTSVPRLFAPASARRRPVRARTGPRKRPARSRHLTAKQ